MDKLTTVKQGRKILVSVRAYKGDAMTLLAMDLHPSMKENFTGFSIHVTPPARRGYYLFNRFTYSPDVLKKNNLTPADKNITLTLTSPLQIFRWVHTPGTNHFTNQSIFGKYTYAITPRYLINDILQPLDPTLTVTFLFDISPYKSKGLQIGFTRGFIESQAYVRRFGLNNKIRPNQTELLFDIKQNSGPAAADKKKNPALKDYTFEAQHKWLGWQARQLAVDLLNETLANKKMSLDVFAFDLDEPVICAALLQLGAEGRCRIILDDASLHKKEGQLEIVFTDQYLAAAQDDQSLQRGHFQSLSHSKVFIQKLNGKPVKVLTGSTNFSTNGFYINANHVLVLKNKIVAQLYADVFEQSFGKALMKIFRDTALATQDHVIKEPSLPNMTIRFSPHTLPVTENIFAQICERITHADSDVLFAIMNDRSESSIFDAIRVQLNAENVFTYGITDVIGDKKEIMLYKPGSKKGVRIAGRPGQFILPPPFNEEANTPGIGIHHKFVVVNFKGSDPVVYCGSSNLAFKPEQKNGDNLIEIRDKGAVTVFAIEAIRLVDHFEFRNKQFLSQQKKGLPAIHLHASAEAGWVERYFDENDLKMMERVLLIK